MKLRIIISSIIALLVVAAAGYQGFASTARKQPTLQAPQTAEVTTCDVQQTVEAPGVLDNTSTAQILMPVDGHLSQVLVRPGEHVTVGQVLASVEHRSKAEAQAEQALADANSTLKTAQDKYDSMFYPRASDELISKTQAEIDLARVRVARMSDIYRQLGRKSDGNPLKAQALLNLTNAQINLNNLISQYNWYTGHYTQLEIDQTNSALSVAKAQVADAKTVLDSLLLGIKAPFSGVVIAVDVVVGQPLRENDNLFTIIDPKALEVRANVTQEDYPLLITDQNADVYFDARPDVTAKGKVERIVPKLIEGTAPTYDIFISLDDVLDGLADGMTVDTNITIAKRQGVLCLPRNIVHASTDNKAILQVWDGTQTGNREITLGLRGDTSIEILSGLSAGEQVVVK
jgi:RND family efflux transporter MFP subunit